ncbi:hypothetical protein COOONC_26677 [Cooperia oncophora]
MPKLNASRIEAFRNCVESSSFCFCLTASEQISEYLIGIDEPVRLAADLERKPSYGFDSCVKCDEPAAILLFYYAYSTWEGQYIHMEDIYVRPQFRRKGYGRLLWRELGVLAKELHMER